MLHFILLIITLWIVRIIYLIVAKHKNQQHSVKRQKPAKTAIILGSGGHTTEMMAIVNGLNLKNYRPRTYILADSDQTSESKVKQFEQNTSEYEIIRIPRSRNVGQSYFTSIFATLWSILMCIPLVYRMKANLILCNGPGTCVPICLIVFFMQTVFINRSCRIVFVESFCRVQTLSLSGKILLWFTDLFVVQWTHLKQFSTKIKYFERMY